MQLKKLIDKKEININIKQMGTDISKYYQNNPITLLSILKGSLLFSSDLIREIDLQMNIEFLRLASYKGTRRKSIKLNGSIDFDIKGRNMLIIEDIIDSGNTIHYIVDELKNTIQIALKLPHCYSSLVPIILI